MLLGIRLVLGLTWLYQGLWVKLICVDPHHLAVVRAAGLPDAALTVIGSGETLLGVGALSAILWRFVTWFQIGLLVTMNTIGILSGGVEHPAALIVGNLPLLACMLVILRCGPGGLS